VPPGRYPVRMEGPPGMLAYVSAPAARGADGRGPGLGGSRAAPLKRRWPLALDGQPVRYRLPEPAGGIPVRIELREVLERRTAGWRIAAGSRRKAARVRLHTDTGWSLAMDVTPGAVDERLVELDAPGALTVPAVIVTWLPPASRVLWLEGPAGR